jgi:hypothetical protein
MAGARHPRASLCHSLWGPLQLFRRNSFPGSEVTPVSESGVTVGVGREGKSRAAPGQWQLLNLHLQTSAWLWKRMSHSWLGSVSSPLRRETCARRAPTNPGKCGGSACAAPHTLEGQPLPDIAGPAAHPCERGALAFPPRARPRSQLHPLLARGARSCGSKLCRGRARRRRSRS